MRPVREPNPPIAANDDERCPSRIWDTTRNRCAARCYFVASVPHVRHHNGSNWWTARSRNARTVPLASEVICLRLPIETRCRLDAWVLQNGTTRQAVLEALVARWMDENGLTGPSVPEDLASAATGL